MRIGFKILTQDLKNIITEDGLNYLIYAFGSDVPPTSAGTEYFGCTVCNDNAKIIKLPHPIWSGMDGRDVIQMGAVTLGGNGLNS
jgi:hypothetical protein